MATSSSELTPTGDVLPTTYDDLNCGIVLHDPETGAILDANTHLESLYGYTTAELRDMTAAEFSANSYADAAAEMQTQIKTAANGTSQEFDWRIKRGDGRLIWVNIHLSDTIIDDSRYVLGEINDITDYKHTDRRASLFYRLLRHNLRNKITVITGYADHVSDGAESATIQESGAKIEAAATNLNQIAESMKQIETTLTQQRTNRTTQQAVKAVKGTVADLRETYPAASISVSENVELWIAVTDAFHYALSHAIENAIGHAESPEPTVDITIDTSPNTGRVEIRIDDEGPPIPGAELDALDEQAKTTPTHHGSGCGLFVMKWCIETLGGELRIETAEGCGNSVFFYLPPQTPADTDTNTS